jgi:hypothetical protein
MAKLTPKQSIFLAELLNNGGNATAAYRLAFNDKSRGNSCAAKAHALKSHPIIAARIREASARATAAVAAAVERYQITADRVADAMARLAFTDLRQIVDVESVRDEAGKVRQVVRLRDFRDIDADAHVALVKVKRTASGEVSVELADKLAALNSLARLKGWIADKPQAPGNLVMLRVER